MTSRNALDVFFTMHVDILIGRFIDKSCEKRTDGSQDIALTGIVKRRLKLVVRPRYGDCMPNNGHADFRRKCGGHLKIRRLEEVGVGS